MVHISDILDEDLLHQMIREGYVNVQGHPTLPLYIHNYSQQTQFDKYWNEATLACRGLILDSIGNVVARPWRKFFNYGEGRLKIDDVMPVEVTDKMDGSLGILYPASRETRTKFNGGDPMEVTDVDWRIATRGSFASDQAIHATKIWKNKYEDAIWPDNPPVPNEDYTFLFEIIYPQNRIVCNYGDMDDLVLLGAVHVERGYYLGPQEAAGLLDWTGPVTTVFAYRNLAEAFAADPRPNAEGFVVRSGTEIVKIKQVDYIELHRIVTNLSPLTLWRRLSAGDDLPKLLEDIPDEWHDWLRTEYGNLMASYRKVEQRVWASYLEVMGKTVAFESRKDFALVASKNKDSRYLFQMYDKKDISMLIWTEIRPSGAESKEE